MDRILGFVAFREAIMPLNPKGLCHLETAEGFATLGMLGDAEDELGKMDPGVLQNLEVLAVRVEIFSGRRQCELMQAAAKTLAHSDPDNVRWTISWVYATRRAESVEPARLILVNSLQALE